jgi:hypothetical protein
MEGKKRERSYTTNRQETLYYELPEPWVCTPFTVLIFGTQVRRILIIHLKCILGLSCEVLDDICRALKIKIKINQSNTWGSIVIDDIPKILRHLGWKEEEVVRGFAMLNPEKGSKEKLGRDHNPEKKRKQPIQVDDDDEKEEDEIEEYLKVLKQYQGPKGCALYQRMDVGSLFKDRLVKEGIEAKEEEIQRDVWAGDFKTKMENEIRSEMRKNIKDNIEKNPVLVAGLRYQADDENKK